MRVMALGTYTGQCMQTLQWQALQRKADYELAETGSTATYTVYSSNKVDKPAQNILTAEDWGTAVKVKVERFEEDELKSEAVQ
jgi:hypothetical protein